MVFTIWFIIIGCVFVTMALTGSFLKRLPITGAMLYLAVGFVLGPSVVGLIHLDPVDHSLLLERGAEIAVIISLFTAGLKLRTPISDKLWRLPLRLAFLSMAITVGLIALAAYFGMGMSVGAAVLLGAVLAPTDPVLASDVQVNEPGDLSRLRFGLTGEAGLNDGTAFPFVMLGLGLMGLHDLGEFWWRWILIDLIWAILGGLAIGALFGTLIGHLVLYLRRRHREAVGLDDFLALGLVALSYGMALLCQTYGFLAVFAAGVALRRIEMNAPGSQPPGEVRARAQSGENEEIATNPDTAPAYMTEAVLDFNEQIERIGEVALVILVGSILSTGVVQSTTIWFVPVLLLLIRPIGVALGLIGSVTSKYHRLLICWFGIRGIGSIYYLMFAIQHGVPREVAYQLTAVVILVVAVSIIIHGISATPLMNAYERWRSRFRPAHLRK